MHMPEDRGREGPASANFLTLRKRCETRLRGIDLPVPLHVPSFCAAVERQRGRQILLRPMHSETGPCGVWLAGQSTDIIFYEKDTSPLHQQHIILHELSHLLCGHRPVPVSETELPQLLFPDLSP